MHAYANNEASSHAYKGIFIHPKCYLVARSVWGGIVSVQIRVGGPFQEVTDDPCESIGWRRKLRAASSAVCDAKGWRLCSERRLCRFESCRTDHLNQWVRRREPVLLLGQAFSRAPRISLIFHFHGLLLNEYLFPLSMGSSECESRIARHFNHE